MEYDVNKDYGVTKVIERMVTEEFGVTDEKKAAAQIKGAIYALFIA